MQENLLALRLLVIKYLVKTGLEIYLAEHWYNPNGSSFELLGKGMCTWTSDPLQSGIYQGIYSVSNFDLLVHCIL